MPEQEQNVNGPKKLMFYIKLVTAIVVLCLTIGGAIWGMNTTFATKPEVENKLQRVAEKSVETFKMFQRTYQDEQRRQALLYYNQQIEESHRRERYIREDLQRNPNNIFLQNRLQDELRLQDFYRQKRDSLLAD